MLILTNCERDKEMFFGEIIYDDDSKHPLVTFIYDPNDSINVAYNKQFKKTVNYTKIPYKTLSCKAFKENCEIPKTTKVLIVTNSSILDDKTFKNIVDFVTNGGTIVLPIISNDYRYRFLAGITPKANPKKQNYAYGYKFAKNVLPDYKNKTYTGYSEHNGFLKSDFNTNISVWATALNNQNYPALLNHKLGNGNVIVFNSKQPALKQYRGLYFSAILSGLEGIPYPIANTSTIFVDDFPAPTYNESERPKLKEFNTSDSYFFKNIWWPDMLKLAKNENITYTMMACFDYSNKTEPPFLFYEWENSLTNAKKTIAGDQIINDILKFNHELAFHGYNHISLLETQWSNPLHMKSALKAVLKKWKLSGYGSLPKTYVPASNQIDSIGLKVLHNAMPNIKYNCSLYFEDYKKGGNREFDYEPKNNALFNFPRITGGYALNEQTTFNLFSAYLYTGIWSHFVHPDDVLQTNYESKTKGNFQLRNKEKLGWRISPNGKQGMLFKFKAHIKRMKRIFPLMRFKNAQQAAKNAKQWRYTNYNHAESENTYTVATKNNALTPNYWFTYVSDKNSTSFEKNLKQQQLNYTQTPFLNGFLYNIKTTTSSLTTLNIQNKKEKNKLKNTEQQLIEYKTASNRSNDMHNINLLIENGNSDAAILALKKILINEGNTNINHWKKLFTYLSWKNRQFEIWPLLENEYNTTKDNTWIDLSLFFIKNSDYPDLNTRKRWMKRQLKLYPDNLALQLQYDMFFAENALVYNELANLTDQELLNKLKHNSLKNKTQALAILLDKKPKNFLTYLDSLPPCKNKAALPIAETITWHYADNKNYKKAIEWASCADNILEEHINNWKISLGQYEFLKSKNFEKYISLIIYNTPEKALNALSAANASCADNFSEQLLKDIAYAYSNKGDYKNALKWSKCILDFNIQQQLYWLVKLKRYKDFNTRYKLHKITHPYDTNTDWFAAKMYFQIGNIKKAWEIASGLPLLEKFNKLRKQLNQAVHYSNPTDQKYLLDNYPAYFYPEVADKIEKQIVTTQNPFIKTTSAIVTNPTYIIGHNSTLNIGFYNRRKNKHLIGITQNKRFPLYNIPISTYNKEHSLYGLTYGFQQKKRTKAPYFEASTSVEKSNYNKLFYAINTTLFLKQKNSYRFLNLNYKPEITSLAYSLNIYKLSLNFQNEQQLNKKIINTTVLNGSYFSDNAYKAYILNTLYYTLNINKHSAFVPNLEAFATLGSKNYLIDSPYWILKKRFYSGGGVTYKYNNSFNKLQFTIGAALFYDSFSNNFKRANAQLNVPIFKYFHLNSYAYLSSFQNQFSNEFNLGLTYYIK